MRAVLAATAAVAVLSASACSTGSAQTTVLASPSSSAATSPQPTGSAAGLEPGASVPPTSGTRTTAGRPWAEVVLTRASPEGSREVTVHLKVRGEVYRTLQGGPNGTPLAAATDEGSGSEYTWGDGGRGGSDAGDVTCSEKPPLIPLRRSETLQHTYDKPGTYTLTFTQTACVVPGYTTRALIITVR